MKQTQLRNVVTVVQRGPARTSMIWLILKAVVALFASGAVLAILIAMGAG